MNQISIADHLVGNLYYNLAAVPLIAGQLEPETMRLVAGPESAMMYSEMCRQMKEGSGPLSVGAIEKGLQEQGFQMDWLAKLQGRLEVESIATLHNYVDEIDNAAQLMRIQRECNEAITRANEPGARAENVSADLLTNVSKSQERMADTIHPADSAIAKLRDKVAAIRDGQPVMGASTGLDGLDKVFRLVDGKLYTFAGRPSQGKTSVARWVFYERAKQISTEGDKGQVVFFSSDDTADAVYMGLACAIAWVNLNHVTENKATPQQWVNLEHAFAEIERLPIVVDEMSNPTVERMYYRSAMLNAQKPIRLAGQDYMQQIVVDNAKSERQEAQRAAEGVKGIGRTLGFPWINLSQIGKSVEDRADKWPTPSDLLYSGEAESDVVCLFMRPEHYKLRGEPVICEPEEEEGTMLVNIGKNKTGDIGRAALGFRKEYGRPVDLEYHRTYVTKEGY